jgi:hypothetical protein
MPMQANDGDQHRAIVDADDHRWPGLPNTD